MARQPQTATPAAPSPEAPPLTPAENQGVPAPAPDSVDPAPGAAAEAAAVAAATEASAAEPAAPAAEQDPAAKPYNRNDHAEFIAEQRRKDREKHARTTPDVRDMIDPASQVRSANDVANDAAPPAADAAPAAAAPEPNDATAPEPAAPAGDQVPVVQGAQPGERMILVEVEGMRVSVPESKVSAALARGIAAERALGARTQQPAAPAPQDGGTVAPQAEQDPDEAEERRAYIRALQYGTEEEAAEAQAKLEARLAKRANPIDVPRLVEEKLEETGKLEALERLAGKYPEVYADRKLALLSGPTLQEVLAERGIVGRQPNAAEYAAAMDVAFDRIITTYAGKQSRLTTTAPSAPAPAAPSTATPTTTRGTPSVAPRAIEVRREVKRSQPTPPVATQAAPFAPTSPGRQSRSDTIREARKARGQVV